MHYKNFLDKFISSEKLISFLNLPGKRFVCESKELFLRWFKEHHNVLENGTIILHDSDNALCDINNLKEFKKEKMLSIEYSTELH